MQRFLKRVFRVLLVTAVASSSAEGLGAAPVLVVNSSIDAEVLPAGDVRRMFLGSKSRIDGVSVVLAVREGGSAHEMFLREVLAKSPQQFTSHWRKILFSGKGKLPRAFDSDQDVIEFVSVTPGAIGYIDSSAAPTAGVRLVGID